MKKILSKYGVKNTGKIGKVTWEKGDYRYITFYSGDLLDDKPHGKGINTYENGEIYEDTWDFSDTESILRTLVDKIYYVRWGQPYDKFYFKAGALDTYTLGHGILVSNYSNIIERPQIRRIGLNMKYKLNDNMITHI